MHQHNTGYNGFRDNSSTDISSTTLRLHCRRSVVDEMSVDEVSVDSTDTSSNDISSTSVSVSITANQQRPLSYSFAKTCYIFSGIQLLITEKIIFINPASIKWNLFSSMHPG